MTKGAHLWAVGFDDMKRAEHVRAEIVRLAETRCLILLDTAIAIRYPDGIVTVDGEAFVSIPRPSDHSFASFLMSLALGAPPLTGPAVGALERAAGGAAADVGISEDFIEKAQSLMNPSTSVLFILDQEGNMHEILQGIRGLGGTILNTNVDMAHATIIQATLTGVGGGPEVRP